MNTESTYEEIWQELFSTSAESFVKKWKQKIYRLNGLING